jgi:hypothetical protein
MPTLRACSQILWNNLWITRSWLARLHIGHGLRSCAHFLIKGRCAKRERINGVALKWCLARDQLKPGTERNPLTQGLSEYFLT